MKKFYLLSLIVLSISIISVFAQCDKISSQEVFEKVNKGFSDDYSLELSEKKVSAQSISFSPCSPLNYNCINSFQFCLINYSDQCYQSIKYKITINTPDGKVIHNKVYATKISLVPEGTIPIKQLLGNDVKSKWSFYQNQFPTNIEILKLDIDIKNTVNLMFKTVKDFGTSTLTEGKKKGIIERYEYAKKLDPKAEDDEARELYNRCNPNSVQKPSEEKGKQETTKIDPEFEKFWKEFQSAVKKNDKEKLISMFNFPYIDYFVDGDNPPKIKATKIKKMNPDEVPHFDYKAIKKEKYKKITLDSKDVAYKYLKDKTNPVFSFIGVYGGEDCDAEVYWVSKFNGVYKIFLCTRRCAI
ncbi:MAG: hypothetical protein ABSG15_13535 [FCB group bacterium]|jgi:hypothetical protein